MSTNSVEVVRADPTLRKRAYLVLGALAALLVIGTLVYGDPMEAWDAHIRSVAENDPGRADGLAQGATRVLILIIELLGASALSLGTWFGRKLWKADRWPAVGARLLHDTPVMYGKQLRFIALVCFSLGCFVFAVLSYAAWRLWAVFAQGQ